MQHIGRAASVVECDKNCGMNFPTKSYDSDVRESANLRVCVCMNEQWAIMLMILLLSSLRIFRVSTGRSDLHISHQKNEHVLFVNVARAFAKFECPKYFRNKNIYPLMHNVHEIRRISRAHFFLFIHKFMPYI